MKISMTRNDSSERLIMISLATCMFLSSIGTSIANVALPNLSKAFSASLPEIQWVIISYLLANSLFIVVVGRIGDRIGRQKMLSFGILIFSLSSFFCAFSQPLLLIFVGRALQGIGAATLMALTVALVSDLIPKERLGRTMGLLGTASAIGTASGPSIGGLILSVLSWPYIFVFLGTIGLCIFILNYLFLPPLSGAPKPLPDNTGRNLPFSLFKHDSLSKSLVTNVCVSMVMMSTLVIGPFYLSKSLHLSTMLVGMVMTVGPVASIISGVPAGRAVDRLGSGKVIMMGLGLIIVGCFFFTILPSRLGVAGYVLSAALLSPGYQMFQAGNNSSVMLGVSDHQKGLISGILSLSRNSGLIIGASGMGLIYSNYGMERTFTVAAFVAFFAFLLEAGVVRFQRRKL